MVPLDPGRTSGLARGLRLLATCDQRAIAADIRQPVTLIHGAGDALMPLGAAQWLATRLPAARLELMGDCGHAPFLSRPGECAEHLRAACDD